MSHCRVHVRTEDGPLIWNQIHHENLDGKKIGISFASDKLDMNNPFLIAGLSIIAAYAVGTHLRVSQEFDVLTKIKLTERETEVLRWLADGSTSTETVERLNISLGTVEKHYRTALIKLGACNRTHAIVIAMRLGFIK